MNPPNKPVTVNSVDTVVEEHIAKMTDQDFFGPVFWICVCFFAFVWLGFYAWRCTTKGKDLSGKKFANSRRSLLPWK